MAKTSGRFITLDGLDGVGKSTHIHFIATYLQQQRIDTVITREPGGTPLGNKVRDLLLDNSIDIDAETQLFLLFAMRSTHVNSIIKPNLAQGKWVVSDRFTKDSAFAYQGGGVGLDLNYINTLESLVKNNITPDLSIFLDLSVEVAQARLVQCGQLDRIERRGVDFHQRVRSAFLTRAQQEPQRIKVVDASGSIDQVQARIQHILAEFCQQN